MGAILLVAGSAVAASALWMPLSTRPRHLRAQNLRGTQLPLVLGLIVALAGLGPILFRAAYLVVRDGITGSVEGSARIAAGAVVVFVAGLLDDLRGRSGPRGLRRHLRALADRKPTTGILKFVAAVLGAGVVAVLLPHRPALPTVLGLVEMAGCANLWNGLDVAPGRAAKAWLLCALGLLVAGPWTPNVLLALIGAELPCAWLDLRERGMLGDAGANLLGFVIGAELYVLLSTTGLALAAGLVVALNLLAETVTLSRSIELVQPLRWADRLGRLRTPSS